MDNRESLLDAKSLGKMLSLSKRQVFRLKACGKLPQSIKIGGAVRWRESDIFAWLQMGCPTVVEFQKRKASNNA